MEISWNIRYHPSEIFLVQNHYLFSWEISTAWLQLRSTSALWLRLTAGKQHQISSRTSFVEVCWNVKICQNVEFLGGMIGKRLELLGLRQCAKQKSAFRKAGRNYGWSGQIRHCFGDSGRLGLQICMISPDPTNVTTCFLPLILLRRTARLQYAHNTLNNAVKDSKASELSLFQGRCEYDLFCADYTVVLMYLIHPCFTITSPSNFDLMEWSIFTSKRMSPVSWLVGHWLACTIGWSGIGRCPQKWENLQCKFRAENRLLKSKPGVRQKDCRLTCFRFHLPFSHCSHGQFSCSSVLKARTYPPSRHARRTLLVILIEIPM